MKLFKGLRKLFTGLVSRLFSGKGKSKAASLIPETVAEEITEYETTEDEVDTVIDNFRQFIQSMIEDDYSMRYSHSFRDTGKRTASGTDAKSWSVEQIVGYGIETGGVLQQAIDEVGKERVAQSIQENGEYIQELAEQIVFAIYESQYARWGGGKSAYFSALELEMKMMLVGYGI